MSHIAKVELQVMDLAALQEAAEKLGGEYLPNEKSWRWYGRFMNDYSGQDAAYRHGIKPERYGTADAGIIRFAKATYDIGVYRVPGEDGKYCLVFDNWQNGQGLETICGKNLAGLKERYGATVSTKMLVAKGFKVREERDQQTKRLRLVATRGGLAVK